MKLALECPDDLIGHIQPFADFDWILADRYQNSTEYANHYRESTNIKFVDNSVTDLGEPVDYSVLEDVFEDCQGTYVISPDWIGDYQQTIDAYPDCLARFGEKATVGVLQGSSPAEALQCLDMYKGNLVAVPYRVGGSEKGDPDWLKELRRVLVVSHIPADKAIHLLGFTTTSELAWYTNRLNVVSIDTDVPVRAGLAQEDLDDFDRTQNIDDRPFNTDSWAAICRNVALLRKAASR